LRILVFFLLSIYLYGVDAILQIEKDVEVRTHIGIVDSSSQRNSTIEDILLSDLKISGHFLVDDKIYNEDFDTPIMTPSLKNQEYVLKYRFESLNGSSLSIRLLKASDSKEVFKKKYSISNKLKAPFLIHKAIYDINGFLRYPDIDWINRYVIFSRYTTPKHSEIVIADYTFHYKKVVIRGGLNLFPKWANREQKSFFYTSFNGLYPTLYRLNIYTGAKSKIISSEGMLVCSDINKNGNKILLTMAPNGQPDIYQLDLSTKTKQRITTFEGIDVNGKYINDGSSIVFVSNRLGYANIFKKSISGIGGVTQMVFHGKNNNSIDSYNNKIVYSSRESSNSFGMNKFNIYLQELDTGRLRAITTTGNNQFPRFNNDGNIIEYIKRYDGSSYIGYSNLATHKSLLFPLGVKKIQAIDW
jgi:TolB protein